jgi:hypothetical protein
LALLHAQGLPHGIYTKFYSLHQVRHPLKQIASMLAHRAWGFADQAVTISDYELLGCMQYWDRIGHEKCDIPDIPRDTNSNDKTKPLSWDDLFNMDEAYATRIVEMANRYGYSVPEMDKADCRNRGELETARVASV